MQSERDFHVCFTFLLIDSRDLDVEGSTCYRTFYERRHLLVLLILLIIRSSQMHSKNEYTVLSTQNI